MATLETATTKSAFLAVLDDALAVQPSNIAIKMHRNDVAAMNDAQFAAHRAKMFSPEREAAVRATAARMVAEIKRGRK